MPVLFLILIGLLTAIYWEDVNANIAIIGSISTALAFMATAWAAYEARASAKAAMKAVKITSDSLLEARKSSFKQGLELLFAQHDSLHAQVSHELETDTNIKSRLGINGVKYYYVALSKKPVLIKYVNLIISLLDYIDREFYSNANSVNDRRQYIEQLSIRIDPSVKLAIAVLGLQVYSNKTYNQPQLYLLLTKFSFFENELFFDKAYEQANSLDNYIHTNFYNEYRKNIEFYVQLMVLNREAGIANPIKDNPHRDHQKLDIAIYWCYKNICGDILKKSFETLPGMVRDSIENKIEKAPREINKIIESISNLIGCTVKVSSSKNFTIRNKRHLIRLVELYGKNKEIINSGSVYIFNSSSSTYLDAFDSKLDEYILNISLMKFGKELNNDVVIGEIINVVEEITAIYKSNLDRFIQN